MIELCNKNLLMIGPMGSGKTTVGRALAARLGRPFFDCDEVLLAQAGCSMATLIQGIGEEAFRERETTVLKSLLQKQSIVLATGGGVVLAAENRQSLKPQGFVVYLAVSLSTQLARLAGDVDRPLLNVPDKAKKLSELNRKREVYYSELSDLTIPVDDLTVDNIVQEILSATVCL